jgi:prevent-host-death family protein
VSQAKAQLSKLIEKALLGGEVIVAKGDRPLVRIVPIKPLSRKPGTGKGVRMAADFHATPEDFGDYT